MLERLVIPEEEAAKRGLKRIDLQRLRPVVVLAGPNGGGKSRILNSLRVALKRAKNYEVLQERASAIGANGADSKIVHRMAETTEVEIEAFQTDGVSRVSPTNQRVVVIYPFDVNQPPADPESIRRVDLKYVPIGNSNASRKSSRTSTTSVASAIGKGGRI
jgi:energy-coupling factor transporter ATP-binding protein EcfA2